jgi:hypothetical protein
MVRVESIDCSAGVLSVRCSGVVGIGGQSVASMRCVSDALAEWMGAHSDDSVREIIVDFTDVDYRWGDAPISCMIRFCRRGDRRVHYVASAGSAAALEGLFRMANIPWFSVERIGS